MFWYKGDLYCSGYTIEDYYTCRKEGVDYFYDTYPAPYDPSEMES